MFVYSPRATGGTFLGFSEPSPNLTNVFISILWSLSQDEITKYVPKAFMYTVTAYTLYVVVIVSL